MVRQLFVIAVFTAISGNAVAPQIPSKVWGKWIVRRDLPASTISCWGESEVKKLIGTEIEYTADTFRWEKTTVARPIVKIEVVSAEQFSKENSGGGANDSQVDFRQLGITANQATQITLIHEPAEITGATTEIPGDRILIKGPNTIVFSVCNVYFEARRQRASPGNHK
jgi:hypothetical protein